MVKKLIFALIIAVLLVQSIGGFGVLATQNGAVGDTDSSQETSSSSPENGTSQEGESDPDNDGNQKDNKENQNIENTSPNSVSSTEANISVKISEYSTNKRIYKDDDFYVVLTITNYSSVDIEDVYVTVDRSSSFYIPSEKEQAYLLNAIGQNGKSE